jgi:hypothetical protein
MVASPEVEGDFTLPALPVVFWSNVGKLVKLAALPSGARTLTPITRPRFVLAVAALITVQVPAVS